MKKSLVVITSVISFNLFSVYAASHIDMIRIHSNASGSTEPFVEEGVVSRGGTSADDLARIKQHILGYGKQLGLPDDVVVVGQTGCCPLFSTSFNDAERFLLNEFAGQLLTRFLAIALDDLADGQLDGIAYGRKVSYAKEVGELLGVKVSEEDLKEPAPLDAGWMVRLIELSVDVTSMIIQSGGQKEKLVVAAGAFAKDKMNKARKSLAVALIQETDRIIALELGNGRIDGLDAEGHVIDWKKEMKDSVERSLNLVLDGVM